MTTPKPVSVVEALRGISKLLAGSKHTAAPWAWFGNEYGMYLATPDRGRQFIMGFKRWGMRGAEPTFQVDGLMVPASELVRFVVDPSIKGMKAGKEAPSVYRYDFASIDHPDARLIAAAPTLLEALEYIELRRDHFHQTLKEFGWGHKYTSRALDDLALSGECARAALKAAKEPQP